MAGAELLGTFPFLHASSTQPFCCGCSMDLLCCWGRGGRGSSSESLPKPRQLHDLGTCLADPRVPKPVGRGGGDVVGLICSLLPFFSLSVFVSSLLASLCMCLALLSALPASAWRWGTSRKGYGSDLFLAPSPCSAHVHLHRPPVSLVIASQPRNYSAFTSLVPGVCRELS